MVNKEVAKAVKKELKTVARKRSKDEEDDDDELCQVDFDNLEINSDSEVSA